MDNYNSSYYVPKRYYSTPANTYDVAPVKSRPLISFEAALRIFYLFFVFMFVVLSYQLLNAMVEKNRQYIIYQDILNKQQLVSTQINQLKNQVDLAKRESNISYRATKEIGMIRINNKNAVSLSAPQYYYEEYPETIDSFEDFNTLEALKSIFKF